MLIVAVVIRMNNCLLNLQNFPEISKKVKQETIDNSLSTLDDPPYCHRLSHAHQLQLIYVPLGIQEISKKNLDFFLPHLLHNVQQ